MRDTALFPVTACSQRLHSSRKHTETERGERGEGKERGKKRGETDEGGKRQERFYFRGEGEGYKPLSRAVC